MTTLTEQPADRTDLKPAQEGSEGLLELMKLVAKARQLTAGGIHANAADPEMNPSELRFLIESLRCLNDAAEFLMNAPNFTVRAGAAGIAAVGGE